MGVGPPRCAPEKENSEVTVTKPSFSKGEAIICHSLENGKCVSWMCFEYSQGVLSVIFAFSWQQKRTRVA